MKQNESIYMVCPFCRSVIGKSTGTDQIEIKCHKCGRLLVINYRDNALTVREFNMDYRANGYI